MARRRTGSAPRLGRGATECRHRLGEGRRVCDRQEIARIGEVRGREGGSRDLGRAEAELTEEPLVQGPLDLDRARGVLAEHHEPVVAGGAGGGDRERAGELAKVERILHRVEAEGLARERAVREPPQEGVPEDRGVDAGDRAPELVGKGDGSPRATIVLRSRARPARTLDRRARRGLRSDTRGRLRDGGAAVSPYELAAHTWALDPTPPADALRTAE